MPAPSLDSPRARGAFLLLGSLALCLSNGATAHPAAAWLAPVLLLRFAVTTSPLGGTAALALAGAVASYVSMLGVIPIAQAEFLVTCVISGLLGTLPYLAHRLLAPALGSVAGTLVFPAAAVALAYALSLASPFGSWGADGYVQAGFLPLMQFAAVAGVWGVGFFVFWCASASQGLFPPGPRRGRFAFGVFAVGFILALACGSWRIWRAPEAPDGVEVAALSTPAGLPDRFFDGCAGRDDSACRDAGAWKRIDALFERSAAAAGTGAALVVWPEGSAQYDAPLEAEFVRRAQAFVRQHGVYLVAGTLRIPVDPAAAMDNQALVFAPSGQLAFAYRKAVPVPGEDIVAGDGEIPTLDTPFGRLGVVICFDADFPAKVRQASRRGVDVLAIPANDWRAITPLHGQMARFRAIENGFAVVRAASNGWSVIADPAGRVLAASDAFRAPGGIATARLSAAAARPTPYAEMGDAFALGCLLFIAAALLVVLARRLVHRRRQATASA